MDRLAAELGTEPLRGSRVDRQGFVAAVAGCELVHFHGHALHQPKAPLKSHLQLAGDDRFSAEDVLRLERLNAGLVTLAACQGAVTVVERGDEPLGLVPAFLLAGAGAVVASLWRVDQRSAVEFMEAFYRRLLSSEGSLDKAEALREAALSARAMPEYASPYHWAPFTLHGSWR